MVPGLGLHRIAASNPEGHPEAGEYPVCEFAD